MAEENEGEDSGNSGPSLPPTVNTPMKELLEQANLFKELFMYTYEDFKNSKQSFEVSESDRTLTKAIDRAEFIDHLAGLIGAAADPQRRGMVIADVDAMEEEDEGAEEEVLDTIMMLIEHFKDHKVWFKGVKLQGSQKSRHQTEEVEYSVNGMLNRLGEVAQQVLEMKGKGNP